MRSLVAWMVLAGCASTSEWDPPPTAAVARCDYRRIPSDEARARSTIHFDARGLAIQVDGFGLRGKDSLILEYDAQDRLVRSTSDDEQSAYTYAGSDVTRTGNFGTFRYELDAAGRVVAYHQGPTTWMYEYDAEGRILRLTVDSTKRSETVYTYDDRGRLATADEDGERLAYRYTEDGNTLAIEARDGLDVHNRWTVVLDEQQRPIRVTDERERFGIVEYVYADGGFEERQIVNGRSWVVGASGACPAPKLDLLPKPIAIRWHFSMVHTVFPQQDSQETLLTSLFD